MSEMPPRLLSDDPEETLDSPRCRMIRAAMAYHAARPGAVVIITEPWRRGYLIELATHLGYHYAKRHNSLANTAAAERGVRVLAVGQTQYVRSTLGIFVDPEVVRQEQDHEFWVTVDYRLARIADIFRKAPDAASL